MFNGSIPTTLVAEVIMAASQAIAPVTTVYVTKSGDKYHSFGWRYLKKSSTTVDMAKTKEPYSPCASYRGNP